MVAETSCGERCVSCGLVQPAIAMGLEKVATAGNLLWPLVDEDLGMQPRKLTLKGFRGIRDGLGLPEITLDLERCRFRTGLATFAAAEAVGADGRVVGVDVSGRMIDAARTTAAERQLSNVSFARMDAEALTLPDASFDAVLCAFGLMYLPEPEQGLREMRRVLRQGGRLAIVIWGERSRCAWSVVFEIIEREVATDVCPLFFRLGQSDRLAQACAAAGFDAVEQKRIATTLNYADGDLACDAVLVGGPVALAWSRFDADARLRVRRSYLDAIAAYRDGPGYRLPVESVVVSAVA